MFAEARNRRGRLAAFALLAGVQFATAATALPDAPPKFPALDRPALQRQAPERAVLQAVARAGTRLVAVGERGTVVLSDDDGGHWRQAARVPVSVTLTALQFVGPREGWAVGHGGVIVHTLDAGDTWTVQADGRALARDALAASIARADAQPGDPAAARQLKASRLLVADGPVQPLLDLRFSDSRHGIVVGAYNLAFETRDGGVSWHSLMDRLPNPKDLHLYGIATVAGAIVIVGEQGLVLRSSDDGASFEAVASPYAGTWFRLAALPDGGLVVAGLRGNAAYSSDQGRTWSRIEGNSRTAASFVGAVAINDDTVLLADQAGRLATSRKGAPLVALPLPALPPLADLLPLSGGGLLAVGLNGPLRLPMSTATPTATAAPAPPGTPR